MSNASFWNGVIPAITTPFTADGQVDHVFLAEHARSMIDAGCTGIVPLGSLGEAATLSFEEKLAIMRTLVKALDGRAPVIPGIASLSTDEAVRLAKEAKAIGCGGLMVLPPYVYSTDWREMGAHLRAVIAATDLPCMAYNNPVAYKTDFTPEQIAALAAEFPNLQAVKESSGDVRRFAALKTLLGDRLVLLVGMDDAIVEGVSMGATGWIAGQVNAYPRESVKLFELARDGGAKAAAELYAWFLPLLRLDTVPKFVQLIKLTQQKVNMGSERVRAPRLEMDGAEREAALRVIDHAINTRPVL
ncbi:dihydrodipicolinate synthase family protein [Dyella tabacisoli]|uniref:Dihydrodipicolinate synthase family protein n=1 Tax=Dyella tabacisoli TaxID=2282381 RepID=A0A369ULU8_9GAMM|nr:dihydrodipicolinate synthase family protein [Dyella tabacisoli]RDD81724.1 dihydrodipicolinate synthase family protein [Dyella tabacisoli]